MAICTLIRALQEEIKFHRYNTGGSWEEAIDDWRKKGHCQRFLREHQEELLEKTDDCASCQFNGKCDFSQSKREIPRTRGLTLHWFIVEKGIPEPSEKVLKV